MVQSQIEDNADPAMLWPGVTVEQLAPWLFDAELAIEWVATAGRRAAAVSTDIPAAARCELVAALAQLARAIRTPRAGGLQAAASRAQRILDQPAAADEPAARRLALAIINAATATAEVRVIVETASAPPPVVENVEPDADTAAEPPDSGLRPTTRQAIQVTVAASLAIVVGESVSPSRWFWAVIAAFVIFAGTNSWGETLTKGWQRLFGTVLGVPAGVLVATLFAGDKTASLVAIFVCLFCAFYFMTVTYSLMTFWITTMLALLYGLLGEFSFGVLLLRIEETAIGAVIGVAVAILVLPTNTRTAIRNDTRAFLTSLSELIAISTATMFSARETARPSEQARELDRDLQQFRVSTKPLLAGVAGLAARRSIRRELRLFSACDRYGRSLARNAEQHRDPVGSEALSDAFTSAAAQTRRNINALIAIVDRAGEMAVNSATDDLDSAECLARHPDGEEPGPDTRRFLTAVHALRQIDRAVVTAAINVGARDSVKPPSPVST